MKFILIFIALLPFAATAQDCQIKKETDPFTRQPKLSTGFISLQLTSLSIDADKKSFDFFFTLEGADKCFDDNSTVVAVFDGNKQKTTFRNSGSMNCEGLFHFTVRNGPETPFAVKRFSTQKISQLIFTGNNNKKPTVITFTPAQQQTLMEVTACIATDAKALAN
ncbi:MAG: hypothetical protein JWM28_1438 [Chitinophagaceae bacterium]|nr:hypothetical protein [Chitinophagaceae bacterium]